MRFHLPALPGRSTAPANSSCAYSQKARKFKTMMQARGHEVILYGGVEEDVACYDGSLLPLPFNPRNWIDSNKRAAAAINERAEEGDFLLVAAGRCQEDLVAEVPLMAVEYGVGYGGVLEGFRVFESYAWMHAVYGTRSNGDAHSLDGRYFDAVIPNYFDPDEFEFRPVKGDYLLYLARMIPRKGVHLAAAIAEAAGVPLITAGEGEHVPDYGEHLGPVGPEKRSTLLANARALLAPTQYVEPFGGAVVEAALSGTPAITTDWGAFPETVVQGLTGYRCRTLGEFLWAVDHLDELHSGAIHERACDTYSLAAVAPQYERHFERLQTLAGDGFNDPTPRPPQGLGAGLPI